jgi:hypothetical protein
MAMQIAERPQIDQDVEDQPITSLMLTQQIVVRTPTAYRELEQLLLLCSAELLDDCRNLAKRVAVSVVLVEQRLDDLVERLAGS